MQGGISHQWGDVTWVLGDIFYNVFFMEHHGRSSPSPTTFILQSKATSCPSCCPCQGEITIEGWLWLSWTGFFREEKVQKDEENGIFLSLLSFLGDICLLKLYLPPFSPVLLLSAGGVRPGKKGCPPRKRSSRENGPRDHSAAITGAAPHLKACIKYN